MNVVHTPGNEKREFTAYLPNGETMQVRAGYAISAQYKAAAHMLANGMADGLFSTQMEGVDFIKVEAR
jgi:hypothetical protein